MCFDSHLLNELPRHIALCVARQMADIAGVKHKRGTRGVVALRQSGKVLSVAAASGIGTLLKPICESLIWTKLSADGFVRAAVGLKRWEMSRGRRPLTVHSNPAPAHRQDSRT